MIVVLDTNILVSGYLTTGFCRRLILQAIAETEVRLSRYILRETADKLRTKFRVADADVEKILAGYWEGWIIPLVEPSAIPADACPDPKDLPILGTAIAARAEYLITGDRHLLELEKYHGVRIVSPREFLRFVAKGRDR